MLKNLLQMHLKLPPKRAIQKAAGATGDLTGNKLGDKITKVSRTTSQNNSETVENETKTTLSMIKKYPRKDIYLQKKDRKLLMI